MNSPFRFSSRLCNFRSAAGLATAALLIPALVPANGRAQTPDQPTPAANPPAAAAPTPSPAATPAPTTAPAAASNNEAPVMLSPFEVSASQSQGYLTTNTLAGTRMNTNIGDLAGSITVVTKEQMENTNSLNINDVLRFEANTQGASTYTPIVMTRSNVTDVLEGGGSTTGNYTDALDSGNRIRGLAAADNEEDNFWASSRLPFDSYNTDSIEIDRGPNSIIFGTGSPAGIVNQSRSTAVLDKFDGEVNIQGGSWGTFRESADFNIPLIQDHLAIYVANLYNSEGFEQKPSSDITRRQYAALTYEPFTNHKTKLQFSFENYNNYANDPNSLTPVDFVTPWLASGRPVWNPVTDQVTYLNTGQTSVPYAMTTTEPNYVPGEPIGNTALTSTTSPMFVPGMTFFSAGHDIMFIDQGNLENFYRGQQTSLDIPGWVPSTLTSSQALVNEERLTESVNLPTPANYATWQVPSIVSKSIYDWSTVNINSMGNAETQGKTYHADLQQEIFNSDKWGSLNLDLGWFRQEIEQLQDDPIAQANATTMYVDTNTLLPNGSPNPHVGQPFIDVYESDVYEQPEINNNLRGMLEYTLDLQDKVPSWMSWLGHHRFLVVDSQHDDVLTNLRYRPAIIGGDLNYLPTSTTINAANGYAYSSNAAIEQVFYLNPAGAAPNGTASLSPGYFNRPAIYGPAPFGTSYLTGPTTVPITTYDYATGQWITTNVDMKSVPYTTGGLSENLQDSKTYFWQSWFWDDRIVGSLGIDDTQVKNRSTVFPTAVNADTVLYPNGGLPTAQSESYWYNESPWAYTGGNTSTTGVVVHPLKNWAGLDNAANSGNLAAAFLRTLSFTFNKSNNFNPPAANYTDFFGNPLGKSTGAEKDYGVEISTPDNKLFLRATWFTTSDLNQITSFTSTARATYMDTQIKDWATAVVEIQNGESPSDPNFGNQNVYPLTPAETTSIASLMGVPYNFGGNVGGNGEYINPASTENGIAKGTEIELEYNPTPNWTMKFDWGHQVTTVSGAAAQPLAWVNYRLPYWTTVAAPSSMQGTYTLSNGNPMYIGNFWQSYGAPSESATGPGNGNGYNTTQLYYNDVVASQLAIDTANNGTLAPNQEQYSWSYLTNYTFTRGFMRGVGIGGAINYDGRSNAGYYGSTTLLNSSGQIAAPNTNEPIYTPSETHIDLWTSYQFNLPWSHLASQVQFNVTDLTSTGYLVPVSFNYNGTPAAERIIPPRQYSLEVTVKY